MLAARVLGFPTPGDRLRPRPAQRHRLLDRRSRMSDFVLNILLGVGPELHRPRRAAADTGMGRDDRRGQGVHPAGLVDLHPAGAGRGADRHGAQPDRRRPRPALRRSPRTAPADDALAPALLEIENLTVAFDTRARPPCSPTTACRSRSGPARRSASSARSAAASRCSAAPCCGFCLAGRRTADRRRLASRAATCCDARRARMRAGARHRTSP